MFTTTLMGQWVPLTWMTLGLDYVVWGMNPAGYHLTNILLHAANAVLFYFLARRLLHRARPSIGARALGLGAAAAAIFFSVHPLRAESVAWVTERRDVLSGFFFFLTLLAYLRACEREGHRRARWLGTALGLYAAALLAKPMVTTLPAVLVILDFYPLRRFGPAWREWMAPPARRIWAEKIPFLILALIAAGVAVYAMQANQGLTSLAELSLLSRVGLVAHGLVFYLVKTALPITLSPLYELPPHVSLREPRFLVSTLVAIGLTTGFVVARRRWPGGLAVWSAYAVMLVPVSGLFHNGAQLAHDRYSYLPCLGWALLVGAGVQTLLDAHASARARVPVPRRVSPSLLRLTIGVVGLWMLALAALTWRQTEVWGDELWAYAVDTEPDCSICHRNLGAVLANRGSPALAVQHYQRALALRPDRTSVHGSLGVALLDAGQPAEAAVRLRRALDADPTNASARASLGVTLVRQGKTDEGMRELMEAIRLKPGDSEVLTSAGIAFAEGGSPREAVRHFRRAIEINPAAPLPHFWLARTYLALGAPGPAEAEYAAFKILDPRLASRLPLTPDR